MTDISETISDMYMGFPEQSKEALTKTLSVLTESDDKYPHGALVLLAGGNRCGKSHLIRPPSGTAGHQVEGEIISALKAAGQTPLFFNDVKTALNELGDDARGKTIIFPDEYATAMMADVQIDQGHGVVKDLGEFGDLLKLKEKGAKILLSLGLHSNIVVAPADVESDLQPIVNRAVIKLKALMWQLHEEPDTHILHLDRSADRTFEAFKMLARDDSYGTRKELGDDERFTHYAEHGSFPDDRSTLRGSSFGRSVPMNTDGGMIKKMLELLGTKNPNGQWSLVAEKEARKLFDTDYFKPFKIEQNDLQPPKRKAVAS